MVMEEEVLAVPAAAAPEAVPAEFAVSAVDPDGHIGIVYSCAAHLAATARVMLPVNAPLPALVQPADPAVHGCKGHQEDWATG